MKNTGKRYFNMEVEPLLNSPKMREIQEMKLRDAVKYLYRTCPFDRKRMDDAGIQPEDVRSFDDFSAIPVAGQAQYRQVFEETGGDLFAAYDVLFGKERMKDIHMLTTTSGTTGTPTPYPVFHKSVEAMGELFGRIGWRIGIRPGDRLAIGFGLSMHAAGTPHLYWFKNLRGLTLLPIGAEVGSERLLTLIKLFQANVLSCTPSLAQYLIERSPVVLGHAVKDLGIKLILCGAEPGAGIPEVRRHLESRFGAQVFDGGAGYGVSCHHPDYQGMHWIADDHCYYELVDPETGKPVPMEHGATGLAVFTPLEPDCAIFFANLRFTLNDIHQVFTEPCPCGLTGFRYKIVGRADDMLKVKGVPVYPAAIQGVINGFLPRVTGAFRIVLKVPPPRVLPPLEMRVEHGEGMQEGDLPGLEQEIGDKMHALLKIRPKITWLSPNTLERSVKKTNFFDKDYEQGSG